MKKIRYLLPGLFLVPLLCTVIFFCHGFDRFLFHRLTDSFFRQSLENDALNLHFTLAAPEEYGITLKSAALPVYSKENTLASAEAMQTFMDQLSRLHPDRLKEEDRYTYDLLFSWLEFQLAGQEFSYYEEPLSPSSGMQSELPLLFAEYTLRDKEDVTTYLSLLESVGPYLQGLADYESEKARAGLFMTASDAENVISQCDRIMDKNALQSGSHFLQSTFESRLEKLCQENLLTASEKEFYLSENDRILTTVVLPAYEKLGDDLLLLAEKGQYDGGLWEMPDGREYYAWLVKKTTGTMLDMDGVYAILQKTFQKKFADYKSLAAKYRELTGSAPDPTLLAEGFPLSEPAEILTDLQSRMKEDFPPLAALSSETINCTIKDVDTALEQYTSPAFYMTPPVDDLCHNTICINRSSTSEGIELYTTLAHEGYPGHLYQTVYSSLYASGQKGLPVRELLFYGGYVEGWAYYTEQLSYGYAAELMADGASSAVSGLTADADSSGLTADASGLTADASGLTANAAANASGLTADASGISAASLLCRLISVQRDLQINLFSLLDISLHYYGADRKDILRSLTSFGLPEESAERIYNYLRTDPAVYLKYYVGYLEMTALKNRAKAQWGDAFTPMRFHRFVLEAGPSDFMNLTKRLKAASP